MKNMDSDLNFKNVVAHPECQYAINLLSLEKKEFFIYGGAVRDWAQYELGRTKSYTPNDFDIIVRIDPNTFQNHLSSLVKNGTVTPTKKGKAPFFRMGNSENFRVFWSNNQNQEKHTDIKCMGSENLNNVLSKCMLTIDSMAVDKNGVLHDPVNGLNDLINKHVYFNGSAGDSIYENPNNVFRYYAMCDSLNVAPKLGEDACKIAAPIIPYRPFYELNSRLNAVLAKENGHVIFKQLSEEGLFNYLPLPYTLNPKMVDQVVSLEKQFHLKPMRGARVLAAFHDSTSITNNKRETTISNLEARKKWETETETRQDRLAKISEKFDEKVEILETIERIDNDPDLLNNIFYTSWSSMDVGDQLAVLLLSNSVYKEFTENSNLISEAKSAVQTYIDLVKQDPKGIKFFRNTL